MKKGDKVTIITRTRGGTYYIEGTARIIEPGESDGWYKVQFDEDGSVYPRLIVPEAQRHPQVFVDNMNRASEVR